MGAKLVSLKIMSSSKEVERLLLNKGDTHLLNYLKWILNAVLLRYARLLYMLCPISLSLFCNA